MALLQVAEVFGNDTLHALSKEIRSDPHCPFMGSRCNKGNRDSPLGICSYTDGISATVVCPIRFRQKARLFVDVGRLAFGEGKRVLVVPEVRILEIPASGRRIGKVDFLLALLDSDDEPIDFAAVEVQAVYVSGRTTRPLLDHFLETGELKRAGRRRPDFRSSAQKRLMPQLSLKVPVFRRWGKKFYVAVDSSFFDALPALPQVSVDAAEITWLVYPITRDDAGFTMREPLIVYTQWDDVVTSLREGIPPSREEILNSLRKARGKSQVIGT